MLPFPAGARPGKINMMSLPNSAISRLLPERKPSPTPTSSNRDPTPHAIPNMVRNERSLCAHRLRKICAKVSATARMIVSHCTGIGGTAARNQACTPNLADTNTDQAASLLIAIFASTETNDPTVGLRVKTLRGGGCDRLLAAVPGTQ